jgi:hypothetical protein
LAASTSGLEQADRKLLLPLFAFWSLLGSKPERVLSRHH